MRICIDIDGVLAVGKSNWPRYDVCVVVQDAVTSVQKLLDAGHYIILYTSRFEEDRAVTRQWLRRIGFLYDRLIMDKPYADVYIDDKGLRFENWEETCEKLLQLSRV